MKYTRIQRRDQRIIAFREYTADGQGIQNYKRFKLHQRCNGLILVAADFRSGQAVSISHARPKQAWRLRLGEEEEL